VEGVVEKGVTQEPMQGVVEKGVTQEPMQEPVKQGCQAQARYLHIDIPVARVAD
jgi:hypothetical protein